MKKLIALLLVFLILLSFSACIEKSPEQQLAEARRQSEWAKQNADAAQKELDDLRSAIEEYEYWKEQVENAG